VTLGRADAARHLTFVHEPRKLPVVLSPEEVARLLEAAPGVKYKAALSVAYGAGLRVNIDIRVIQVRLFMLINRVPSEHINAKTSSKRAVSLGGPR